MGPNIVMSDQPIVVPLSLRDSDFDGVSDYDELYVLGTNPYAVDTDRDGIPDGSDLNHEYSQLRSFPTLLNS
jgi:hypothetical protein